MGISSEFNEIMATDSPASTITVNDTTNIRLRVRDGNEESSVTGEDRRVTWTEDTFDNEDCVVRKSKCCCIFKTKLEFGESSSESLSDDSTLSDDTRLRRQRKREAKDKKWNALREQHSKNPSHNCKHEHA